MNDERPDVSILITTYNRAESLRRTLTDIAALDRAGLEVEVIVADNNSTDQTRQVADAFARHMRLRYVFDPRPGQNFARNRALDQVPLGRIVAITDDDITPRRDWVRQIAAACDRWPGATVFGGRIHPVWPSPRRPSWTDFPDIQTFCFGVHDRGETEGLYVSGVTPFGGNCWFRSDIFAEGWRFSTGFGPRPKNRIMGGETTFLLRLSRAGHPIVYCPRAIVGHRLQPELLCERMVRRRAFRQGRMIAHTRGLPAPDLLARSPLLWRLRRYASLGWALLGYGASFLSLCPNRRIERAVQTLWDIGLDYESLRTVCGAVPELCSPSGIHRPLQPQPREGNLSAADQRQGGLR